MASSSLGALRTYEYVPVWRLVYFDGCPSLWELRCHGSRRNRNVIDVRVGSD
jgi:hypothetical protein